MTVGSRVAPDVSVRSRRNTDGRSALAGPAKTTFNAAMAMSARTLAAVLDVLWMDRAGAGRIARRQQARLERMVAHARSASPFYRELYRGLPGGAPDLSALPVVTKPQLMEHFDDVVTDRSVTRAEVDAFLAEPGNIGRPFHGSYLVAKSSGTSGHPGVFLLDERARVLQAMIPRARGSLTSWFGPVAALRFLVTGRRYALVAVGGGPYAAFTMFEWTRREHPKVTGSMRFVSVMDPIEAQVGQLNEFRPRALGGYPSAIRLLAREQAAGRLHIEPMFVVLAGETVLPSARRAIESAFGCPAYEEFGSTENGVLAVQCREGWLHAMTDWYALEAVDARYRPVPDGTRSHTLLVTNLANRLMPLIRYDQGDSVLFRPGPCPCGSRFPAMTVIGRTDDVLVLPGPGGHGTVSFEPAGIVAAVEDTPGISRVQLVQRSAADIEIRLQVDRGADRREVQAAARSRLASFLAAHGAGSVTLHASDDPPALHPVSGKFAQVVRSDALARPRASPARR